MLLSRNRRAQDPVPARVSGNTGVTETPVKRDGEQHGWAERQRRIAVRTLRVADGTNFVHSFLAIADASDRVRRPVFADTDGAAADADGRPMAEVVAKVDTSLGEAAGAVGPDAAVAALQGAVNDVGDAQVRARSPREGEQASRLVPRLAVDGVARPRTGEAVRLALHHAGRSRLDEALSARLGRTPRTRSYA